MQRARVTGAVHATLKDAGLTGRPLLICETVTGGAEIIAADTLGAGLGDLVVIATGSAARMPAATAGAPVDAAIVAILDDVKHRQPRRE